VAGKGIIWRTEYTSGKLVSVVVKMGARGGVVG
jgi:hypothetical protein